MNVNLTPQQEEFIQQKVASGGYNNASEVVREAIRMLQEHDRAREMKLTLLRQAIQEGIDSGPAEPMEDAETLIQMAREKKEARRLTRNGS